MLLQEGKLSIHTYRIYNRIPITYYLIGSKWPKFSMGCEITNKVSAGSQTVWTIWCFCKERTFCCFSSITCWHVYWQISAVMTECQDLRTRNLKLRHGLDEAMDKFELIFGEKVDLENFTEALQVSLTSVRSYTGVFQNYASTILMLPLQIRIYM